MKSCWKPVLIATALSLVLMSSEISILYSQNTLNVTITDAVTVPETGELRLFVTVTHPDGKPENNLQAENFRVSETAEGETVANRIVTFTLQTESEMRAAEGSRSEVPPLSIALAIDTSESMRGRPLEQAQLASIDFVNSRPEGDQIALYSFSTDLRLEQDFTTNKDVLNAAITQLQAGGTTALYEAIYGVTRALAGRGGRRAFVVLTDGQNDTVLPRTRAEAIESARSAGAPGYMLGFGATLDAALAQVAEQTGGRYLKQPNADGIATLLDDLAVIMDQYVLTYMPPPVAEEAVGERRKIAVTVNTGDAEGYDFVMVEIQPRALATSTAVAPCPTDHPDYPNCPPNEEPEDLPLGILAAAGALGLLAIILIVAAVLLWRRSAEEHCEDCGQPYRRGEQHVCPVSPPEPPPPGPEEEPPIGPKEEEITRPIEERTQQLYDAYLVTQDGEEHEITKDEFLIGRKDTNDLHISDDYTSRTHAKIVKIDNEYTLIHLSKTNPTTVNGEQVTKKKLEDGDRIRVGNTDIVFRRRLFFGQSSKS